MASLARRTRARVSRGFRWLVLHARTTLFLPSVLSRHTLSRRRGPPRLTGPLTARVRMDGGSARPRVVNRATPGKGPLRVLEGAGVFAPCRLPPLLLSLVHLLAGRPLGLRLSLHSGSSQQGPAPRLVLAPSATPRCSPISEAKRVYIVDSFIVAHNAQSTSLVPFLIWSHLQRQTKLSLS